MDRRDIVIGLLTAVLVALLLSPWASPWPDGLERVAQDKGFLEKGEVPPAITSPIPDYAWPGIKNEKIATSTAGIAGTVIVFTLCYGLATLLKKRNTG